MRVLLTSFVVFPLVSAGGVDAEFAASLLASLMNQRDMAEAIVHSGGLARIVTLVGAGHSAQITSSLFSALR